MQFGGALHRICHQVRHANPRFGPVHLGKYDIKDGFYCLFLNALDCLRLAIIMPRYEGEEQLVVAIPMSCTMGWVQSPPTFCAMSETVANLANKRMATSPSAAEPHHLKTLASHMDRAPGDSLPEPRGAEDNEASLALSALHHPTPDSPHISSKVEERAPISNRPLTSPVGTMDVFVDDFIQLGQGSPHHLQTLQHPQLLHSVNAVLSQPEPDDKRNEAGCVPQEAVDWRWQL
jgi:hypothetical protein